MPVPTRRATFADRLSPAAPKRRAALTVLCTIALGLGLVGAFPAASLADEALIEPLRELQAAGEASADAAHKLEAIERKIPVDASYPLQRQLARTRLVVLQDTLGFERKLAMMQALRELADANGDADTVNLMDIKRIFMSHADDEIGKYLDQLNAVRTRIHDDASAEVMEALELSYGNMYFDAGHFDTALRHQLAALDWAEKLPFGKERARLYRLATIAELYNAMDLPDAALEVVERAFAQPSGSIPLQNRISLFAARALALMSKGSLEAAEQALGQAEALARSDDSPFTALRIGTLRAEMLLATASPEQAMTAIERVDALARQRNETYYLAKSKLLRGHALTLLNRVDEGVALMEQATAFFEGRGQMIDVLAGLDRQIRTLRERKRYDRAVERMERRQQLWTRLFRNERGRAIAEVEARHTAQELTHRIDALSAENRAQDESLRAERLGKALALVLALFGISLSALLVIAIRRARRERDRLSDVVRHDALTGASSRYQFQRRRERGPADTRPDAGTATGLLLLDLDHFKSINDQFGHEAGDAVLKTVVERIRSVLDDGDELYRWGGEEFLVVFNGRDEPALERDVLRLLEQIERAPVPWHEQAMPISVSGGFVRHPLAPGWQAPLVDAIRWADAALYLAKNSGRRRIERVELSESGRHELHGRRPIDLPQLLDWQRHGYLEIRSLSLAAAAPTDL